MVSATAKWIATNPLCSHGLLTEAERNKVDSFIRDRVYKPGETTPENNFTNLILTGASALKRRYKNYNIEVANLLWGWAASQTDLKVERPQLGGGKDNGWRISAPILGRWTTETPTKHFSIRTCALYPAVPEATGVQKYEATGWCFGTSTLRDLLHSVRRTYNKYHLSVFYADILFMAMVGMIYGDIMRKTALLSEINWDWWDILSPSLHLHYAPLAATALKKYVRKLRRQLENDSQTLIPTTVKGLIVWVIDLCCGFQSHACKK